MIRYLVRSSERNRIEDRTLTHDVLSAGEGYFNFNVARGAHGGSGKVTEPSHADGGTVHEEAVKFAKQKECRDRIVVNFWVEID